MSKNSVIANSKILVVGTGGIGCELLYCLAKTGFKRIVAIDKDTIELSNLNRQFLFKTKDIGKSKVETAKNTLLNWFPSLEIVAHHSDVISDSFNVKFFEGFDIVMNALDNREARSHVNKMCHYAGVNLIDGGSGGYFGQVVTIKWNETECYECVPHSLPQIYPFCTIRNTPSELIHCVIWAKYVFEEIFSSNNNQLENYKSDPEYKSLGQWFNNTDKTFETLVGKIFISDIQDLLKMEKLWENRNQPNLLSEELLKENDEENINLKDLSLNNEIFDLKIQLSIFKKSFNALFLNKEERSIEFDKDDDLCIAFVSSGANIRASLFHIDLGSCFTIKTIAGSIVPAIASTNDIIASLCVIEAVKVLNKSNNIREVYLSQNSISNKIISSMKRSKPNSQCHICSSNNMIYVRCKMSTFTIAELKNLILKKSLGIFKSDVNIDGPESAIIISADESENDENLEKSLSFFGIKPGSVLNILDYYTDQHILLYMESENIPNDQLFLISKHKFENDDSEESEKEMDKNIGKSKRKRPADS